MTTPQTELIILFGDIAQSTRLYDVLGDNAAQKLVGICLARLSDMAVKHGGTVIKTIGDEVMCTFQEVEGAVSAAKAMHKVLDERFHTGEGAGVSLDLRVGIPGGSSAFVKCPDALKSNAALLLDRQHSLIP